MPSRIEDIAQQIRFAIGSHNREDSGETGAFPVRAPAETAIAAVVSDKKELTKEVIAEIALLPLADSLKALDKASPGMGFTTAILVALDEQHAFAGRKNLQALANRSYLSPGFVIGKLLTSDIPISIQDAFLAAGSYFVGEARRVAANFPLIEKDRATDNAQLRGVSAAREAFFPG